MKRTFAMVLAMVLLVTCVVGATLAWLNDTTDKITNTFTVGNVDIDMNETKTDFKMNPGSDIAKDPKITVQAGSEDCWVFVDIDESANLGTYIDYTVATGWTQLTKDKDGNDITANLIYYRDGKAGDEFSVLANDKVTVLTTVTNAQMKEAETNKPTLAFTAYAVQKINLNSAAEAWAAAQDGVVKSGVGA